MEKRSAVILTLGCRLNQADSALLATRLTEIGFEIVPEDVSSPPNLIVLNSCAVTASAVKKTRRLLRTMRAQNPSAFIVLTGCSAEIERDFYSQSQDCDLVVSNESKKNIGRILKRHLADVPCVETPKQPDDPDIFCEGVRSEFPFRTRAILKIQEGCNNRCAYCIVPQVRGPERSRKLEETLEDFRRLVDRGFLEIVLSGVNICSYSCQKADLPILLEKLLAVAGKTRIRLSSTEPSPIIPRVVDIIRQSEGRICNSLHLPLQHGTDAILKAMNRKYTTKEFASYVNYARENIPDIHIGTDIIAGFPGESAEHFKKSYAFIQEMKFANTHVFPFSPRPETVAATLKGKVPLVSVTDRTRNLKALAHSNKLDFAASLVGHTGTVLVESRTEDRDWYGRSSNYMKTEIHSPNNLMKQVVTVRFEDYNADTGLMIASEIESHEDNGD